MIKKAIYILLILTIFFTPISVFMRSVCFYLAVLLLIVLPLKLYWKQISYVDVFFVAIFLIYIIQIVKFKDYKNWFKSFSGSFLIYVLLFQMFNMVYRNIKDTLSKKKFIDIILAMVLVSAVLLSIYVLYQYPVINKSVAELNKNGKYKLTGYFIKTGAWKISIMGDKNVYATGKWGHWNIYSAHLVISLLIILYFFISCPEKKKTKWIKFFLIIPVPLIIINIYFTFSRGALLISIPIIFCILVLTQFKQMKWYIFSFGIVFLLIGGFIFLSKNNSLKTTLKNRISQLKKIDINLSTDRDKIFRCAVKEVRGNLFWGIGPGSVICMYGKSVNYQRGAVKTAHNIILQIWLELGFAGFITYLIFFTTFIWKNIKMIYNEPCCTEKYFLGIITFSWLFAQIIRNFWDYLFIDSGYGFLFWTMIFVNLVTLQKEEKDITTKNTKEKEREKKK